MRVKTIEVYNTTGVFSATGAIREDVESAIQKWLDENPNVTIEHVAHSAIYSPGFDRESPAHSVLVTIFYRD